jgi:transposase
MDLVPDDSVPTRKHGFRSSNCFRKSKVDVRQPELVPFSSILDFLDPDDPTLWVLKLQETLPLNLFPETSRTGGYGYDPRMLFTVWMFGLWTGAKSSRQLETMIRRDVRFIAIAGGLRPDHATLCRFRRSLGDSMDGLLGHSVDLAVKAGMVSFKRGHVDGHRLPGNVSQWRKLCKEAEAEDEKDEKEEKDEKPKGGRGKDPDARTIITKKGFVKGYNAQALADEESGIVLSARVSNCSNDASELDPVLERCIEIHGDLPDQLAADKGFDSSRNAYALELLGVESFIPARIPSVFTLDSDDELVCPAGHHPDRTEHFKQTGVSYERRVVTQCKGCCLWEDCLKTGEKRFRKAPKPGKEPTKPPRFERSIRTPEDVPIEPWLDMHARTQTDEGKTVKKKRSCTVERVFAHTKTRLGFTRFSLRGLDLVDLEWTLEMVVHNLWRIANAASNALFALFMGYLRLFFPVQSRSATILTPFSQSAKKLLLAA